MLGPFGFTEVLFILVLALLIFGPKRLPEMGRTIGRALGEFRRASSDLKRSFENELDLDAEPGTPAPRPRPAAAQPRPTVAAVPALEAPGLEDGSEPSIGIEPEAEPAAEASGGDDAQAAEPAEPAEADSEPSRAGSSTE